MSFKSFTILLVQPCTGAVLLVFAAMHNLVPVSVSTYLCLLSLMLEKNLATSNTGVFIEIVWKIVSGTSSGLREWVELKMRLPFHFSSSPLGSLVLVTTLTFYTTVEERRRVLFCLYSCQSRAESLSGCGLV